MCALRPVLHHKCPPSLSCQWYCVCSRIWGGWGERGQRSSIHNNTRTTTLTCMHTHAHIHRCACTNTRTYMTYPITPNDWEPITYKCPSNCWREFPTIFNSSAIPSPLAPLRGDNHCQWATHPVMYEQRMTTAMLHMWCTDSDTIMEILTCSRGIQHWIVTCTQQWEV